MSDVRHNPFCGLTKLALLAGSVLAATPALAQSDGGALDCLNDNAQILQSALPVTEFSAIEKALNEFEFETALERIRTAVASLQ